MKKKVKDCTKEEIFNAIFNDGQTSVGDDNCKFCVYNDSCAICAIYCDDEYETCIDFEEIKRLVGEEEIEVEDNVD